MKQRLISAWPFAVVALIGGAAVLARLLTQFNPVDDEGYVLLSLNEFLRGGDLYDQVFTQYGPVYYELYGALFSIPGIEPNHETGRVIVALLDVVMATGAGVLASYVTQNRWIGVGTQIVAFGVLFQIVREPTHPIALTTLLVLAMMGFALWRGHARTIAITLGCLAAALTLVKINMGVPAGAAVVVAALIAFGPERHRKAILGGSALLLAAIVIGIGSSKIDFGWVRLLLALELAGVLAVLGRTLPLQRPDDAPALGRWLALFFAGAIVTALTACLLIIALGTSPSGLVDGVIVAPSRHPADQSSDLMLRWWIIPLALVALGLCWASVTGRTKRLPMEIRACGRLAAGAAIWLSITAAAPGGVDPGTDRLIAGVLLGWLAIAPPSESADDRNPVSFGRLAAVLIAVVGAMQAYPIGFSRVEAAAVPFAIVGALLLGDGVRQLQAARAKVPKDRRPALDAIGVVVPIALLAMIGIATVLQPGFSSARDYKRGRSVNLPGMSLLHLPNATATSYEQLASRGARLRSAHRAAELLLAVSVGKAQAADGPERERLAAAARVQGAARGRERDQGQAGAVPAPQPAGRGGPDRRQRDRACARPPALPAAFGDPL